MNWSKVRIEHGHCTKQGHRILLHQCSAADKLALDGRCGSSALYTVTRTSTLTGTTYSDHVCATHAQGWGPLPAAN